MFSEIGAPNLCFFFGKMMTEREHQLVKLTIQVCSKLYLFPHEFDGNSEMVVTRSHLRQILVRINSFISLSYATFLILRLHPTSGAYTREELNTITFELLFHFIMAPVHLTAFAIQVSANSYKAELTMLYNQILQFNLEKGKIK